MSFFVAREFFKTPDASENDLLSRLAVADHIFLLSIFQLKESSSLKDRSRETCPFGGRITFSTISSKKLSISDVRCST